jgi:hypothetical protein
MSTQTKANQAQAKANQAPANSAQNQAPANPTQANSAQPKAKANPAQPKAKANQAQAKANANAKNCKDLNVNVGNQRYKVTVCKNVSKKKKVQNGQNKIISMNSSLAKGLAPPRPYPPADSVLKSNNDRPKQSQI